jgi:hypothetical protein
MTPEELTEACHAARVRYNKPLSLLLRFADVKTHLQSAARMSAYWYYSLIFRKEVYKKHGMRFGLQ